jgi:hypothetical protein
MATFAVVKDTLVVNCISADSKEDAELIVNQVMVDGVPTMPENPEFTCVEYVVVAPGDSYIDGKFIKVEIEIAP